MRLGFNLIQYTDLQGIEVFAQNIISHIKLEENDSLILFVNQKSAELFRDLNPRAMLKIKRFGCLSSLNLILYQQFGFIRNLKREKIDVLFCPSLAGPLLFKNKIVTIHDLAFKRFKKEASLFHRIYLWLGALSAKYYSLKIITISDFSRQEISQLLKINFDQILNISEGAPELPKIKDGDDKKVLTKFNLLENDKIKKYFFYVGNVRPRKNLKQTINAFEKFSQTAPDCLFVLAGRADTKLIKLKKYLLKRGIKEKIVFCGFVTQLEKTILLKNALALVLISLYEGFGLPILEAQSLRVPALCANVSALPETASANGAFFVDPNSLEEIANGFDQIFKNIEIREKISITGVKNLESFSWKNSAEKLITLCKSYEDS